MVEEVGNGGLLLGMLGSGMAVARQVFVVMLIRTKGEATVVMLPYAQMHGRCIYLYWQTDKILSLTRLYRVRANKHSELHRLGLSRAGQA